MVLDHCMYVLASEDNEFLLYWDPGRDLSIYLRGDKSSLDDISPGDLDAYWVNWHKHCFTWKSIGQFVVSIHIDHVLSP